MKIAHINIFYKKGSTGKIIYDIVSLSNERGVTSKVFYGRGDRLHDDNVVKTSIEFLSIFNMYYAGLTGLPYSGNILATWNMIRQLKKFNPDIVHIHCLNCNYVNIYGLLSYLKKRSIKTIITLHAEFMYTGNCGYAFDCNKWQDGCGNCPNLWEAVHSIFFDRTAYAWRKMKAAFQDFENLHFVAVSSWVKERALKSNIIKGYPVDVIQNGLDTSIFTYYDDRQFAAKFNINREDRVVLHVTPSFRLKIKGGEYVLKVASCFQTQRNIKFVIIGYDAENDTLPDNVIGLPHTNNQMELARFYSLANLTLLTSQRETFSMICAESLCCGTPIVGFKAGAPEKISIKEFSSFVDFGNVELLAKEVGRFVNMDFDKKDISQKAEKKYSKQVMFDHYYKLYNTI